MKYYVESTLRPFGSIAYTSFLGAFFFLLSNFLGGFSIMGKMNIGGTIGAIIDISIPIYMVFLGVSMFRKKVQNLDSKIEITGIVKDVKFISINKSEISDWKYNTTSDQFEINLKDQASLSIPAKNETSFKTQFQYILSEIS